MQTIDIKQPALNWIVVAALAAVMLIAGTIGIILVRQSDTDSGSVRQAAAGSVLTSSVTQADETLMLEQNTELPTGASSNSSTTSVDTSNRFWKPELDTLRMQSDSSRSAAETRYLEQNTWLPAVDLQANSGMENSPTANR